MHWMTSKRDGQCKECENDIPEGTRMVYDPDKYKAYCRTCGEEMIGSDPLEAPDQDIERREALRHAQSRTKRRSQAKKKT